MARSLRRAPRESGILRIVEARGITRGMGGSKGWLYVGTGLWTLRTIRRLGARREEMLLSEEIKPGQRMIIANGVATIESTASPEATSANLSRRAAKKQARVQKKSKR